MDLSAVEHAPGYRDAVAAAFCLAAQVRTAEEAFTCVNALEVALARWDERIVAEPWGMLFIWIVQATIGLDDLRYCLRDSSLAAWRGVCDEGLQRMALAVQIDREDAECHGPA